MQKTSSFIAVLCYFVTKANVYQQHFDDVKFQRHSREGWSSFGQTNSGRKVHFLDQQQTFQPGKFSRYCLSKALVLDPKLGFEQIFWKLHN